MSAFSAQIEDLQGASSAEVKKLEAAISEGLEGCEQKCNEAVNQLDKSTHEQIGQMVASCAGWEEAVAQINNRVSEERDTREECEGKMHAELGTVSSDLRAAWDSFDQHFSGALLTSLFPPHAHHVRFCILLGFIFAYFLPTPWIFKPFHVPLIVLCSQMLFCELVCIIPEMR